MTGQPAVLGLDPSTSRVKALLCGTDGAVLGRGVAGYQVSAPRDGWAETGPERWWQAARAAVRSAVGPGSAEVAGLAIAGQMHGLVLCPGRPGVLRPAIVRLDRRSSAEVGDYLRLPAGPPVPDLVEPAHIALHTHVSCYVVTEGVGRVSRLRSTINARLEEMSFLSGTVVSAGALVIGGAVIALGVTLSGGHGAAQGGAPAAHVTLRPALIPIAVSAPASASPMATYSGGSSGYPRTTRPSPSSATASPSPNPATRLRPHPLHTVPPPPQNPPPSPPDPFQPPGGWEP